MMKKLIILLGLLCCITPVYAQDVRAIKTNESFEEVARIDHVQEIRINTVPRRQYTPTNLRTQYEMRFTGKNDTTGAMTVWSNTFTDYDTKVTGSGLEGDDYYIYDNAGQKFKTGEHVDLTPIKQSINNNVQSINGLNNRVDRMNNRIDNLEHNVYSGLATVTALTSLHPNPRSTDPVELSVGMGMYRDQCAGAAGLFIHPTDNVMIQGGFAFGNSSNYAGFVGTTISLPWFRKKH